MGRSPGLNYSHRVFAQGAQDVTSKADLIQSWNIFLLEQFSFSSPLPTTRRSSNILIFPRERESEDDRTATCVMGWSWEVRWHLGQPCQGGLSWVATVAGGVWVAVGGKLIPRSVSGLIIPLLPWWLFKMWRIHGKAQWIFVNTRSPLAFWISYWALC